MKKLTLALALILTFASGAALANLQCGFKPFKPLGCMNGYYVCMYINGNYQWVLHGC